MRRAPALTDSVGDAVTRMREQISPIAMSPSRVDRYGILHLLQIGIATVRNP
jgi:hypothetical protein